MFLIYICLKYKFNKLIAFFFNTINGKRLLVFPSLYLDSFSIEYHRWFYKNVYWFISIKSKDDLHENIWP